MNNFKKSKIVIIILLIYISTVLFVNKGFAIENIIFENDTMNFFSNLVVLDSDDTGGSVKLQFGTTVGAFLEHDGTLFNFSDDILLLADNQISFRDTDLNINSPLDGELNINADEKIELNSPISEITGELNGSGYVNFSNSSGLRIRENIDPENNSACSHLGELIFDTADNELQYCTTTGSAGLAIWTPLNTEGGSATVLGTSANTFTLDNDSTGGNVNLMFGETVKAYLRHDGSIFYLSDKLDINANSMELGTGEDDDITIDFNDDETTNQRFGWDDSEEAFSTFNEELIMRVKQGSIPPFTCGPTYAGTLWFDTDTGMLYVCDTSNNRNKWLSTQDISLWGENGLLCGSSQDLGSDNDCVVQFGASIGGDGQTMGFYLKDNITITGYGFAEDNDACTSGSFDIEIWGNGNNSTDTGHSLIQTIAEGLTGEAHNSSTLNIDVDGNQYILLGLDNNCGQGIDDYNIIMYYRLRHRSN